MLKTDRQSVIMNLIMKQKVSSQEDLQNRLLESGFDVTQATLSRDLKELHVAKVHDLVDGYRYRVMQPDEPVSIPAGRDFTSGGVRSIEFNENIAVIRTRPGFASVVAAMIDHAALMEIMGTIAGDDTILIMIRKPYASAEVLDSLSAIIPGIKDKVFA